MKTEFPDNKWKYLTKKIAYLYEYSNSIDDYPKRVHNLKKKEFFSKLKTGYLSGKKIEGTKENIKLFNTKNGTNTTIFKK